MDLKIGSEPFQDTGRVGYYIFFVRIYFWWFNIAPYYLYILYCSRKTERNKTIRIRIHAYRFIKYKVRWTIEYIENI